MVFIIRLLVFLLIAFGLYSCLKFFLQPQRKLAQAMASKRTLMMDDKENVHRNILLAYKGVLFEGEKHMGTTHQAFQIVHVFVWARDHAKLVGLDKRDFQEVERLIKHQYPFAEITWRSPIKELM